MSNGDTALTESLAAILPLLVGAFLITHFDVALSPSGAFPLALFALAYLVLLSAPRFATGSMAKGNLRWLLAVLSVGTLVSLGMAAYVTYSGRPLSLFYEWSLIMWACGISLHQVAMRHSWRAPVGNRERHSD